MALTDRQCESARSAAGRGLLLGMLAAVTLAASFAANGRERAAEILQTALEMREDRVADVRNYSLTREIDGREIIVYYERDEGNGRVSFEPVGPLRLGLVSGAFDGTPLARYAPGGSVLDGLKRALLDAATQAGIALLSQQLGGAAPGQVASVVESLLRPPAAGPAAGTPLGALTDPGAFRNALVDGAYRAGMGNLASAVNGLASDRTRALFDAVRETAVPGQLLGELGKTVLKQTLGGGAAGAGGPAGAVGAGHPAQAGLNALARIGGEIMTRQAMNAANEVMTPRLIGDIELYPVIASLGELASLDGTEKTGVRDAWRLHAASLRGIEDADQVRDGALTLWIDQERYVPLRAELTGKTRVEGRWRRIKVTVVREDYREVAGMLFPRRSVTTIEGVSLGVSGAEQQQLQEKLATARRQLERIPPQRRAMVEQMMNQQIGQLNAMMGPGPMEFETRLVAVRVNEGPPAELVKQVEQSLAAVFR